MTFQHDSSQGLGWRVVLSALILFGISLPFHLLSDQPTHVSTSYTIPIGLLSLTTGLIPLFRTPRPSIAKALVIGLLVGISIATLGTVWMLSESGEGEEAAFLLTAVLSLPMTEIVATAFPDSGTARWAPLFTAIVPVVNAMYLALFFVGWNTVLSSTRLYRDIGAPSNEDGEADGDVKRFG
jgi:hypothetical protein